MMLVLQLCVLLFLAASNPRVLLAQSLAAPYDPYRSHSATLDPKELQNLIVRNKTVFLMVADDGVQAQATLSIRSFHLVFPSNRVLVLGFSQSTMEWCEKLSGTLCRFMPHRLPICNYTEGSEIFSGPKRFGTEIFRLIQQCKQNAILQVLLLGFDLFFMDSDSLLLKDPWEVLPMNHSWEGACWGARGKQLKTKHRNVGMMWMRANPEIISVQQEFLDGLSKQPLMVNDEALYAQFADRGALDTYCLPHRIDGLGFFSAIMYAGSRTLSEGSYGACIPPAFIPIESFYGYNKCSAKSLANGFTRVQIPERLFPEKFYATK